MNNEIINIVWLAFSFLALFAFAEILYHYFKIQVEYTRKTVHFGTGIITLLFPIFLNSHWSVLFLCGSFALILSLSLKYNLLKSINAISRNSWGSLLYPLSVYGTFLFFLLFKINESRVGYLFYYLPILMLAVCDPIAALFGKRFPFGKFKIGDGHKTVTGCLAFFISAFLLTLIVFHFFVPNMPINWITLLYYFAIALFATITEAISSRGIDNLSIPLSVMLILFFTQWLTA